MEGAPILTSGVGQDFGLFCMDSDFEEFDWDSTFLACFWELAAATVEPTVVSGTWCADCNSSVSSLWTFFVLWWVSTPGRVDSAIKPSIHTFSHRQNTRSAVSITTSKHPLGQLKHLKMWLIWKCNTQDTLDSLVRECQLLFMTLKETKAIYKRETEIPKVN